MPTADEIRAAAMAGTQTAGAGPATDVPPKSRAKRTGAAGPAESPAEDTPKKLTPAMRALREGVHDIYTSAQMVAFMFDPYAAECINAQKDACADAWIELAQRDAKVKAFLVKLTTGSAWGGVIMAHGLMILPILAKRGIVPGGALFGGAAMNSMAGVGSDPTAEETEMFAEYAAGLAHQGYVTADQRVNGAS